MSKIKILSAISIVFIILGALFSLNFIKQTEVLDIKENISQTSFSNSISEKIEEKKEERASPKIEVLAYKATLLIGEKKYNLPFKAGESAFEAMFRLKQEGEIVFEAKNYSGIGQFIYSIEGVPSDNKHFWILYINNKKAEVGASAYLLSENDEILWKLEESMN